MNHVSISCTKIFLKGWHILASNFLLLVFVKDLAFGNLEVTISMKVRFLTNNSVICHIYNIHGLWSNPRLKWFLYFLNPEDLPHRKLLWSPAVWIQIWLWSQHPSRCQGDSQNLYSKYICIERELPKTTCNLVSGAVIRFL
jgi:hypothetical protein